MQLHTRLSAKQDGKIVEKNNNEETEKIFIWITSSKFKTCMITAYSDLHTIVGSLVKRDGAQERSCVILITVPWPLSTLEKTENLMAATSFRVTLAFITLLLSHREQLPVLWLAMLWNLVLS